MKKRIVALAALMVLMVSLLAGCASWNRGWKSFTSDIGGGLDRTGTEREVRWYSDAEYAKAYGKAEKVNDGGFDGLKHARGFDNGPILVVRGNRAADEPWLCQSIARYAMGIGWHFVSTDSFPDDAPDHFKYVLLGWDEFRDGDDRHMKTPEQLAAIIAKKVRERQFVDMKGAKKVG